MQRNKNRIPNDGKETARQNHRGECPSRKLIRIKTPGRNKLVGRAWLEKGAENVREVGWVRI